MARAIWSGSIGFGMVSIPVKLYGATESKDISFHLLHATCGTRLKQLRWCPTDEQEVPWNETVRGYEYAGYERSIDSHVKNLRHKLGPEAADVVTTVTGVGYRLGVDRDR